MSDASDLQQVIFALEVWYEAVLFFQALLADAAFPARQISDYTAISANGATCSSSRVSFLLTVITQRFGFSITYRLSQWK